MKKLLWIIYLIIQLHGLNAALFPEPDLNAITKLIRQDGYPVEVHENIETTDGYLLDMHRIPYGLKNNNTKRVPVILVHGLMSASDHWIITGPDKGLGYILADAGYDVWMANTRGNSHSRKHVTLNPDNDPEFWQFSWHEIGIYDLPAMFDYILNKTENSQLFYIGHSQGCTSFFVMTSMLPEYNNKVKLMLALAPAVFMSNMQHPASIFSSLGGTGVSEWLANLLGVNELSSSNDVLQLIGSTTCQDSAILQELCTNVLFLLAGYDSRQFNRTLLPRIIGLNTGGASVKQVMHYAQGVNSGHFRPYNFGMLINLSKYGSVEPPDYDLSRVTCPVALYYANNDWLVSEKDIDRLYKELPNPVEKHLIDYDGFNHLDFMWANDVVKLLYNRMLKLMEKYNR